MAIGCGVSAAILVAVLFLGGALVARGGMGKIMDFALGMMQNEMVGMYSADVPPSERKSLEAEMDSLRANSAYSDLLSRIGLHPESGQ